MRGGRRTKKTLSLLLSIGEQLEIRHGFMQGILSMNIFVKMSMKLQD
jgi:hypothetical protein